MNTTQITEIGCRVSEVMTPNPLSLTTDATVEEAAQLMYSADIRHIPICDRQCLVGIVSDRDIQSYSGSFQSGEMLAVDWDESKLNTPLSELIQRDVLSVYPEDDIIEAIDLMLDHKIGAVPVIENGKGQLVGIVSYIDILRTVREGRVRMLMDEVEAARS